MVGSVASSRFGLHRAAPRPEFYLDEMLVLEALYHRSSFNALHLGTGTKLDFFRLKPRAYDRVALEAVR